jgi:hypothetical protein
MGKGGCSQGWKRSPYILKGNITEREDMENIDINGRMIIKLIIHK